MELTEWLILGMADIFQIAVWMIPLIVGIIMVKRGGKRPERFFLAGSGLMVLEHLVTMVKRVHWRLTAMGIIDSSADLKTRGAQAASLSIIYSVFTSLFFLAGMVLLVYAFWLRFRKKADAPVGDSSISAR